MVNLEHIRVKNMDIRIPGRINIYESSVNPKLSTELHEAGRVGHFSGFINATLKPLSNGPNISPKMQSFKFREHLTWPTNNVGSGFFVLVQCRVKFDSEQTLHFYCFHDVRFLSCSFERVTQQ